MDDFIKASGMSMEEFYKHPDVIDGTVYYLDYFDHSCYLRYALQEIYKIFEELIRASPNETRRYTTLGLLYTMVFLTSQVLENLIKSRSLFTLKKDSKLYEFRTLENVVKNYWKSSGHDLKKIIEVSKIEINDEEKRLMDEIEPFFFWGGRFPHPFKQKDYIKVQKNNIRLNYKPERLEILDNMTRRFAKEMGISNQKM